MDGMGERDGHNSNGTLTLTHGEDFEAVTEWKKIETAPKEGRVLVALASEGERWVELHTVEALKYPSIKRVATHWMPLPEPPK